MTKILVTRLLQNRKKQSYWIFDEKLDFQGNASAKSVESSSSSKVFIPSKRFLSGPARLNMIDRRYFCIRPSVKVKRHRF
jgi:hypothetical protein